LELANEIEFALSANIGLTYREDGLGDPCLALWYFLRQQFVA
jgi:hypothetical protein